MAIQIDGFFSEKSGTCDLSKSWDSNDGNGGPGESPAVAKSPWLKATTVDKIRVQVAWKPWLCTGG